MPKLDQLFERGLLKKRYGTDVDTDVVVTKDNFDSGNQIP